MLPSCCPSNSETKANEQEGKMITLYNMDVRKALKMIPDESIDCQICSPPYWGLRDYGKDTETIWDGSPTCEHEFGKRIKMKNRHKKGETNPGKEAWYKEKGAISQVAGNFCKKCNAWKGQLGLEPDLNLYIEHLLEIFDEVKRVLRSDGICWVNLADTYSGNIGKRSGWTDNKLGFSKEEALEKGVCLNRKFDYSLPQKCLCGIPERFMLGMIDHGWVLRNKIIWFKRNHMPSSVKDRFANSWEYLFMFVKNRKYYFDLDSIRIPHKWVNEKGKRIGSDTIGQGSKLTKHDLATNRQYGSYSDPLHAKPLHPKGKNPGDMWDITTRPFKEAHFAVFPEKLVERPIKVTPREICNKCGKPKVRKIIGGNPNAFNIRVRDVKEKRIKHTDRKASEKEVQDYNEKNYVSEQKEIIESCNCKAGFHPAIILDIFAGSGTTLKVARDWGRDATGIEIKPEYCKIIKKRLYGRSKSSPNEFKLVR